MKFIWKLGIVTLILNLVVLRSRPWIQALRKKRLKQFVLSFIWNQRQLERDKDHVKLTKSPFNKDEPISTTAAANQMSLLKSSSCDMELVSRSARSQDQNENRDKLMIHSNGILLNFDGRNFVRILEHSKIHFISIPFEIYSMLILTHNLKATVPLPLPQNMRTIFRKVNVVGSVLSRCTILNEIQDTKQKSNKISQSVKKQASLSENSPSPLYSKSFITSRRTQKRKYSDLNVDVEDRVVTGSVKSPFNKLLENSINNTFSKKSPAVFQLQLNQCPSSPCFNANLKENPQKQHGAQNEGEIDVTYSTPKVIHSYFQQELQQKRSQNRFNLLKKHGYYNNNNCHRRGPIPKQQPTQNMRIKTAMVIQNRQKEEEDEKCPPSKTLKMYDPYWTPKHVLHNDWDIVKLKNESEQSLVHSVLEELDKNHNTEKTDQKEDFFQKVAEEQKKSSVDFESEIQMNDKDLIHFLVIQRFSVQNNILNRKRLIKKSKKEKLNAEI